jgi:hypothetical protein
MSVFIMDKFEGLHLNPIKDSRLEGKTEIYIDASYRGEEARSQIWVIAMVANQLVTWYSWRQNTVSLSITEAEYIAYSEIMKDASWTQQFLNELPLMIRMQSLPILYTDNEAANRLSKNYAYHRRTRHIDHKYHLCSSGS